MTKQISAVLAYLITFQLYAAVPEPDTDRLEPAGTQTAEIRKSILLNLTEGGGSSGESALADEAKKMEMIAKMTANPIGNAWMFWFQNDWSHLDGDTLDNLGVGGQMVNSTKFQPIMAFPFRLFDDDWNFILRPVLQFQSFPLAKQANFSPGDQTSGSILDIAVPTQGFNVNDRTSGLGDTALLTIFGPSRLDGFVWAIGATQIFDTADEDVLGQGKYQVGPAVLIADLAKNVGGWNKGALAQHWWSQSGDDDRVNTSLTDIQYFINYRLSATELVGMSPNIKYNWKAKGGERLTLPIGLGYSDVIKIGPLPVRFAVEIQYNVIKPDNLGVDWNLRFLFIPVIPNPFVAF